MSYFTNREQYILEDVAKQVDEFLDDQRKGVAQSKYVFVVKSTDVWHDWEIDDTDKPVPKELHGYWMMAHAEDTDELSFRDAIKKMRWVKCEKKEVISLEWVEL